jgi:type II secretory pathway component PulF
VKASLQDLSQFAFSMATCLQSGLPAAKALALSGTTSTSKALRSAAETASQKVARGMSISDALEANERLFPHFALPVIRAGELGGRHVEAYQLVHQHCERLKPSLTLVRQAWLYPVICILFGYAVRTGLFLYFGLWSKAWLVVRDDLGGALLSVLVGWALLKVPAVKRGVDYLILQIPGVRETVIRLSVVLFFATFRLVYEAGGLSVSTMFDLAVKTVGNLAVRQDLLEARAVLENQGGFEEAFGAPRLLEDSIKSSLAAGALSGHLGTTLDQIIKTETIQLAATLDLFNRIFQRLVVFGVGMSIIGTLLICLSSVQGR